MAPTHWGNPHLLENPSTTALRSLPEEIVIDVAASILTMPVQTSRTTTQVVEIPTPANGQVYETPHLPPKSYSNSPLLIMVPSPPFVS